MPATAVLIPTTQPRPSASAPARVAGVERRVGLDHVVDDPAGGHGQGAAELRDDARGDGPGEAVGVPDRDDELADAETLGVPELGRGEIAGVESQHGQI